MDIQIEALPHQKKVFESSAKLTSMSCAIGSGKTYTAALLTILELLQGKRVLLITVTYSMLRDVLIAQIIEILNQHSIPYKYNKSVQKVAIGKGELFTKTNRSLETINGLTRIDTVIMDECRLLDEKAYTYSISRQRGIKNARVYLFGTGCSKNHWFAKKSMNPKACWITADIFSNAKHNGQEYIDNMLEEYADLPEEFKKRELHGLFTDGDDFTLFDTVKTNAEWIPGEIKGGLDIAGTGADYSCIAIFNGNKLICLEKKKTMDYNVLTAWKNQLSQLHDCKIWNHDATGIGNLMAWQDSVPINFGAGAGARFANQRARIYFDLKEKLANGICFDSDKVKNIFNNEVYSELMCVELNKKETAKILLNKKEDIKKIIGRSPDLSDSMALAAIPAISAVNYNNLRRMQEINNPFRR